MLPNTKSSSKRKSPPDRMHSEAPQKRAAIPRTITMSDTDTWKQVAEIAENALDNEDDDTILKQVSAVMNDMGQVAMGLLKTRAVIWARKGKYEEELQDAWTMILLAPKNSVGYICAGYRYINQGFQGQAINVFNKGLEKVPKMDVQYGLLIKGKEDAKIRQDRRFDILGCLPYDIGCSIIDKYFSQDQLVQYSRVCSTWRNLITNYPKVWSRIPQQFSMSKNVPLAYKLLPSIRQHIQEFLLRNDTKVTKYLEFIRINSLTSLKSLRILSPSMFLEEQISYMPLSSTLATIAVTLTSLKLFFKSNDTDILSFSDILAICRNLTKLEFHTGARESILLPITISHSTQLRTIGLQSVHEQMNGTELRKLLENSPNLRALSIGHCDDTVYAAIQQYGHSIKDLNIEHDPLSLCSADESYCSDDTPGLKRLSADYFDSPVSLLPLVKEHHTTLRSLYLIFKRTATANSQQWSRMFSLFPFPNMKDLTVFDFELENNNDMENDDDMDDDMDNMIDGISVCLHILPPMMMNNKMCNLRSLCLSHANPIPDNVFDALGKMSNLSELSLTDCVFTTSKMQKFLEICKEKSKINKLTSLNKLDLAGKCNGLNDNIIKTASSIQSLTEIRLHFTDEIEVATNAFVQNVAKLPFLRNITMVCMSMSLAELQILRTSPSLRYVELYTNSEITVADIKCTDFPTHVDVVLNNVLC